MTPWLQNPAHPAAVIQLQHYPPAQLPVLWQRQQERQQLLHCLRHQPQALWQQQQQEVSIQSQHHLLLLLLPLKQH
jgi:hypothetical protein